MGILGLGFALGVESLDFLGEHPKLLLVVSERVVPTFILLLERTVDSFSVVLIETVVLPEFELLYW